MNKYAMNFLLNLLNIPNKILNHRCSNMKVFLSHRIYHHGEYHATFYYPY
jgi:hypothetical protein